MMMVRLHFPDGRIVPVNLPVVPEIGSMMKQSGGFYRVMNVRYESDEPGDDWSVTVDLIAAQHYPYVST